MTFFCEVGWVRQSFPPIRGWGHSGCDFAIEEIKYGEHKIIKNCTVCVFIIQNDNNYFTDGM